MRSATSSSAIRSPAHVSTVSMLRSPATQAACGRSLAGARSLASALRGPDHPYCGVQLPPPPLRSFASDNASGAHPDVIAAIIAANDGHALAYGADDWTAECRSR